MDNPKPITKRIAKIKLDLTTDVELAKILNCTKQNVGTWGDDDPMPIGRQWELIAKYPKLFGPKSGHRAA